MNNKKIKEQFSELLTPDLKKLLVPIISLVIIVICFIFASKIGFNKITDQKTEIDNLEKNITALKQKENTLIKVKETLENDVRFFSLAFPDYNPTFLIINQTKKYSFENSLLVNNLKSGAESKGKNYSKVDINFDLDGNLEGILSFLKLTDKFSPIVTIEKFKLSKATGNYRGTVTLRGYWSSYPKKIPSITQSISDFSEEEMDIIVRISELLVPDITENLPQTNVDRQNPFE